MLSYRDYIDWAERLIYLCEDRKQDEKVLMASAVLLGWISIECFVNNMLDDFASLGGDEFKLYEKALLLEKEIVFEATGNDFGTFSINRDKHIRLSHKILFLIRKFNPKQTDFKGDQFWQDFVELNTLRNKIAHPHKNDDIELTLDIVRKSIETAKNIILFIGQKVWKQKVSF